MRLICLFILFLSLPAEAAQIDVYLNAGQSIQVGTPNTIVPKRANVRLYYEICNLDESQYDFTMWESPPGDDPARDRWDQVVPVESIDLGPQLMNGVPRVGPEYALGQLVKAKYPARNVVIAKFACGGTSLNRHWQNSKGVPLATRMLMWIRKLKHKLEENGDTVVFRAFNWVQGPSDLRYSEDTYSYYANLIFLLDQVVNVTKNPKIAVTISRTNIDFTVLDPALKPFYQANYAMLRGSQEKAAAAGSCRMWITEDGLPHIKVGPDAGIHYPYLNATNIIGQRQFYADEQIAARTLCKMP